MVFPGIKPKIIVPESIIFIPVWGPTKIGDLPEAIEMEQVSLDFKAWLSPRESVIAETWLTEKEIKQVMRPLSKILQSRQRVLEQGGINEERGIFNLEYQIHG